VSPPALGSAAGVVCMILFDAMMIAAIFGWNPLAPW
jgi:hypothetical protein